jgi:hypothetical protein
MSAPKLPTEEVSGESSGKRKMRDIQEQHHWWGSLYVGTKQQFIDIGFLSDGQFPGDDGTPSGHMRRHVVNGSAVKIRRRYKSGRLFEVHVHAPVEVDRCMPDEKRLPANVLRLVAAPAAALTVDQRDTLDAIRRLYDLARRGRLNGVALCEIYDDQRFSCVVVGEAARVPTYTLGMVEMLAETMRQRVRDEAASL